MLFFLVVCSGCLSVWLGFRLFHASARLAFLAGVVGQGITDNVQSVQNLTGWLLLACAVAGTSLAFGALLLGMNMRRWQTAAPMVSLLAAVERAAHGDYGSPITTGSEPEFGELARGVEWLRKTLLDQQQRLNERMQDIERSREDLASNAWALEVAYRQEEERRQELASLAKTTAIITAQLQTKSLLELVVREATQAFRTSFGAVLLSRAGYDHLVLAASTEPESAEHSETRFHPMAFGLEPAPQRAGARIHALAPSTVMCLGVNPSEEDGRDIRVLVTPLVVGDVILGALVLGWRPGRPLSPHEMELAQTFAAHASVALENARLYATLGEEQRLLSHLSVASGAVNAAHELPQLYTLTLEHVVAIAEKEADAAALAIYEPEDDIFTVVSVVVDVKGGAQSVRMPMCDVTPELAWAYAQEATAFTSNIDRLLPEPLIRMLERQNEAAICTVTIIPLLWQTEALGMLLLLRRQPGSLPEPHGAIVRTFVHHAAIAMKNASLLAAERANVQRLARSNELRAEFTSMVSHELKNPLAMLHNYSALLLDYGVLLADEQRATYLRSIHKESATLIHLVGDIMDVSKIDAEILDYALGPCDLHALLQETCDEYRTVASRHQVIYDGDDSAVTVADPQRIQQVLVNFLDNAVKYSPDGGIVAVTLTVSQENGCATVRIRDQGVGIDEEEQLLLFKKFSRVRNERTATIPGTGLGLYICARILAAHGGTYAVESQRGRGTTISFTLPLAATLYREGLEA